MAVRAFTDQAEPLLSAIKQAIADGRVTTWKIDDDGDLTLTSEIFVNRAWMRPKVLPDRLLFNIIGKKNEKTSTRVYAAYHGRLVQMLLAYFDTRLKTVAATALPTKQDKITR